MSVRLIGLVLSTNLPTSEKMLLVVLADASSPEGVSWPRQETIAKATSLADRTIRDLLTSLRDRGLVDWEQRGLRRSNRYTIDVAVLSGLAGQELTAGPDESDRSRTAGQERRSTAGPSGTVRGTARETHPRDPIFETVASVCGIDWTVPMTRSARGQINKAVKELREIEATPEEIVRVSAAYRIRWPDIDLTPTALVKHWSTATAPLPASPEATAAARRRLSPPPDAGRGRELTEGGSEGSSSVS